MKVSTILIGGLALAAVGYFAWSYLGPSPATQGALPQRSAPAPARVAGPGGGLPPAPVVVSEAATAAVPITLSTIGTVQASSTVAIKSQIDGQILQVHFTEGQAVKKGQLLFSLDPRPLEAALRQAEANAAKDKALLQKARTDLSRVSDLAKKDFATQSRLDEMRANAAALEATVRADEALIEVAKLRLEYTNISAPIAGRAGSILVHAGNLVKANDTNALVVVNQTKPIHVQFSVPEANLGEIARRMAEGKVTVSASIPNDTRDSIEGVLTFVNNTVDATTGTIQLKATYDNPDERLTPGQFVNVVVNLATIPQAVVVPSTAVQAGQQGQFVFVVKADNTVEVRPVKTGASHGALVVIEQGVRPGEKVVIEGQLRLRSGTRVVPRMSGAPPGRAGQNAAPG
jgi:multidrug efflux system membrane fusion protein